MSTALIELDRGIRITFRDGEENIIGSINGDVWAYGYEAEDGSWQVQLRIPVFVDGRGPMDVAGQNVSKVFPRD